MALKRKITKAEFDALPDVLKSEYKEHGDGYTLDTDDAAELSAALERQKKEAKAAKDRADALQKEKDDAEAARLAAEEEAARKSGDVSAIEASWQAKLDAEKKKADERAKRLQDTVRQLLVTNVARAIADEISTVPDLLLPHIEKRLAVEYDGDDAKTRVLDATGKPSAATIEELAQEFVANDKYAAIIVASKASGGNAGQHRNDGNPGGKGQSKKIADMTEAERVAHLQAVGQVEFNRQVALEHGRPA